MANNPRTFGSTWQCCVLAAAMSPKHTSNKLITLAYYSRDNIKIANTNSPIKINSVINISHILLSSSSLSLLFIRSWKRPRWGQAMWTLVRMPQLLCEGNKAHHEWRKLTLREVYWGAGIHCSKHFSVFARWHIDVSGWGKANHARTAWPCPAWFVSSC